MNQEGAGCSQNMNAFLDEDNEVEEEATMEEGAVDDDFEMDENSEEAEQQDEEMDEDEEPPFMDEDEGKIWEFARKIQDGQHLKEWCQTNGGLILAEEKSLTHQFDCPIKECQFKAIFLKRCSMVYTRNEHNHGNGMENVQNMKNRKIPRIVGDDYVDKFGRIWKFQEEIGENVRKEMLRKKYGLTDSQNKKLTVFFRCQNNQRRCKFAGVYVKENGCLYTRGEHEHK